LIENLDSKSCFDVGLEKGPLSNMPIPIKGSDIRSCFIRHDLYRRQDYGLLNNEQSYSWLGPFAIVCCCRNCTWDNLMTTRWLKVIQILSGALATCITTKCDFSHTIGWELTTHVCDKVCGFIDYNIWYVLFIVHMLHKSVIWHLCNMCHNLISNCNFNVIYVTINISYCK
jgi:hypothetical protein